MALIASLSTDVLLRIFSILSPVDRQRVAFVSKSWTRQLKASGVLYEDLRVDLRNEARHTRPTHELEFCQFIEWARCRLPFARQLHLTLFSNPAQPGLEIETVSGVFTTCQQYRRLQKLQLCCPGRMWLPEALADLTSLESLTLEADCTASALPEWLGRFRELQELHISMEVIGGHSIQATFLPVQILSMLELRRLTLSDCCALTVTYAVGELPKLEMLAIHRCKKLRFQDRCFMHNTFAAMSLRTLILSDCSLHILPYQIGAITHLVELDLSSNHLSTLPATLSITLSLRSCTNNRLQHLKRLVLRANDFSRLPRLLARLPGLERLDLSYNRRLQVDESEAEQEFISPIARRGFLPQTDVRKLRGYCHSLSTLLRFLPKLWELDLRQERGKHWEAASLKQLEIIKRMAQVSSTDCSLQQLYI